MVSRPQKEFFQRPGRVLFCAVVLLLVSEVGSSLPPDIQKRKTDLPELEKTILAELAETGSPGVVVVVVSRDRVVFAKGFGVANVETGVPVTPDTVFRIGTITTIFTAAALVSLSEEGRINLNAPVGNYLHGLSPKLSLVTAHQLLSHTAGIREEHAEYGLYDDAALGKAVRAWTDDYCMSEAGRIYSHSNPGYALAGLLLEDIGHQP